MKNIIKLLALVSMLTFLLTGCKSTPVMNIDSAAIVVSNQHSHKDVQKAIIRAGATLGWIMKSKGKGRMVGTLRVRKHVAIVDITYSTSSYSIKYLNSTNLKYDGVNIHKNYNGWINNLNRNIQIQISTL